MLGMDCKALPNAALPFRDSKLDVLVVSLSTAGSIVSNNSILQTNFITYTLHCSHKSGTNWRAMHKTGNILCYFMQQFHFDYGCILFYIIFLSKHGLSSPSVCNIRQHHVRYLIYTNKSYLWDEMINCIFPHPNPSENEVADRLLFYVSRKYPAKNKC